MSGRPTSKRVEVAAGLIFERGRLLIAQRRPADHLGGLWEFPGGKREPGESYEDCLRRELTEELGVEIRIEALVETVVHDYPDRSVALRFFRCSIVRGEPQPLGCQALAWVDRAELRQYDFPAADRRLVGRLTASAGLWRQR